MPIVFSRKSHNVLTFLHTVLVISTYYNSGQDWAVIWWVWIRFGGLSEGGKCCIKHLFCYAFFYCVLSGQHSLDEFAVRVNHLLRPVSLLLSLPRLSWKAFTRAQESHLLNLKMNFPRGESAWLFACPALPHFPPSWLAIVVAVNMEFLENLWAEHSAEMLLESYSTESLCLIIALFNHSNAKKKVSIAKSN